MDLCQYVFKKHLELLTVYSFMICLGIDQHMYVVYMYMDRIRLTVHCAAVTSLLHGSSVIVFCCHSGEFYTYWAADSPLCIDLVLGTVDSKL